ncbi:MAG: hypothetical protein Q8918_00450 [Bacteroidota bacterium]|nr:hypothetical protein [Bacteroidota bacterium]MDP4212437.1 hypothetical protein [Bacteroidota bacterium]MDP4248556.1 hypothetical protein [Bacteroidota bacterium]
MMHETANTKNFQIEYKGNHYTCNLIENRGRVTYQIFFNNAYLYLTKAVRSGGILYWTSIPEDSELVHLVDELGVQIDNHFR